MKNHMREVYRWALRRDSEIYGTKFRMVIATDKYSADYAYVVDLITGYASHEVMILADKRKFSENE